MVQNVAEALESIMSDGTTVVPISSTEGIVRAREAAQVLANHMGFSGSDAVVIAATVSEVARGLFDCTIGGEITLSVRKQGVKRGLEVIACTDGLCLTGVSQGTRDDKIKLARLRRRLRTAETLMDEYEVRSGPGPITTVTMRKWLRTNVGIEPYTARNATTSGG